MRSKTIRLRHDGQLSVYKRDGKVHVYAHEEYGAGMGHAPLTTSQARKAFRAGLQIADEIDAEAKEKE